MGLTTMVYIQCITHGFIPNVFPKVPLQVQKALPTLFVISCSCAPPSQSLVQRQSKVLEFCGQLYCLTKESLFLNTLQDSLSNKRYYYRFASVDG
jgi:hypothetical protein